MDFADIVCARRSIRRYVQKEISDGDLRRLVDFARLAPSGKNGQNLRFCVIRKPELAEKVFAETAWAGFIAPRRTPVWGKDAPVAFIALTVKKEAFNVTVAADSGAAIENILLGAVSLGLGGCWIGAFNKANVHELLALPEDVECLNLVALGYPAEKPLLEDTDDPENIRYYLDEDDRLHVPKLSVDELTTWL